MKFSFDLQKNDKWRRVGMKPPQNGTDFWGFNEDTDEDSNSFDEDEENTAGFKPILKVVTNILLFMRISSCITIEHIFFSIILQDKEEDIRMEHLLDGLPMWLDRLFEGSTTRYHINYWPDFKV